MKKFDLNKLLKILRIILLILLILSILPRLFYKANAAEAEPDPVPQPDIVYVFPDYDFSALDGENDVEDSILSFDFFEKLYNPESEFYQAANSLISLDFERSYINSYVSSAEGFQYALSEGLMSPEDFLSYSKLYQICWIHVLGQMFIIMMIGVGCWKFVRSFFIH